MKTEKELNYKGNSIFYRLVGNGNPVLLVHGFGETGDVWHEQVSYLKDKFLLIVPDLPGSGRSEMIEDMTMEGMAETLKAIMEKESLKKVRLIGHSMGGYVALAFAEKYDGRLVSLGLFHSSAYADTDEKKTTRRKGIEFIKEHGAFAFLQTASPNLFSPRFKDEHPELIDEFIQSLNNFSPDSLVSYYESMIKRPDRTTVIKEVKMPVLFIMGEFDNAVPIEDVLKQSHLPERASINILHRSGHMGMMEEKDKSNQLLEEFLSEP